MFIYSDVCSIKTVVLVVCVCGGVHTDPAFICFIVLVKGRSYVPSAVSGPGDISEKLLYIYLNIISYFCFFFLVLHFYNHQKPFLVRETVEGLKFNILQSHAMHM